MKLLGSLYEIESRQVGEGSADFGILLDPEHFIYKAHFPSEPITPGVCIMQIAVELLGEAVGKDLALSLVKNIKFLKIISPDQVLRVNYSLSKIIREESEVRAQVVVSDSENQYAKLSIVCRIR